MQRLARAWKGGGIVVGFVPTMGFLHPGHVSLIHRARSLVSAGGKVVVSIYVNPTQFAPHEDLSKYPRDLPRDLHLCRAAGADVVFVPNDGEMYPEIFSTRVVEEKLSRAMEGASRPTHFAGVTTVVAKLFNIVLPDIAVFGAKDFQQAAVISRMVRDLNFPVRMVVAPTVRESDGLALSSRNKYLSETERSQATILWRALQQARKKVRGRSVSAALLRTDMERLIATQPQARVDYVEFFDPKSLQAVTQVKPGTHMALAVYVGKTRLIDNGRL